MDNTSSDTSSHHRLSTTLPSEAHELLAMEKKEATRRDDEKKSLQRAEEALANELASALRNEKERIDREGMNVLQEFKQNDLTALLKKENIETEAQVEATKNAGLLHIEKAAKLLTETVLSHDFLSTH